MKRCWFLLIACLGVGSFVAGTSAQVLPRSHSSGGSAVTTRGGGFVERPMGTDEQGRPVLGTVYQAGSRQRSEWRRSSRDRWYAGGGLSYYSAGSHGIVRGGHHAPSVWSGGAVWLVNDAGFCYPAVLRSTGIRAWPLVVNPGFGGGLTIVVSF